MLDQIECNHTLTDRLGENQVSAAMPALIRYSLAGKFAPDYAETIDALVVSIALLAQAYVRMPKG